MSDFDNSGKVALWIGRSENPRAPKYKGHAYAHRDIKKGEKVALALWENEPGDRRPVFRGSMEDARDEKPQQAPAQSGDYAPFHDDTDDIPFS